MNKKRNKMKIKKKKNCIQMKWLCTLAIVYHNFIFLLIHIIFNDLFVKVLRCVTFVQLQIAMTIFKCYISDFILLYELKKKSASLNSAMLYLQKVLFTARFTIPRICIQLTVDR